MSATALVDASIVLKWLLDDEEYVPQAVAIRDAHLTRKELILLSPGLVIYEVANGLVMALRRGRLSTSQAREGLEDVLEVDVQITPPNPQRTLIMAHEHNLTAYDAAYLAVAEAEGCPFWTADASLHVAVREKLPWVRWVGDYH